MTAMPPEQQAALVKQADELLDKSMERVRLADQPIWEHQAHLGRSLITLASGGIVLSVSIVQLLKPEVILHWTLLLPSAWICWTIAILGGLLREAWLGSARATTSFFERKRGEIRLQLRALPANYTGAQVDAIFLAALTDSETGPARAKKICDALSMTAYLAFAFGMIAVVAFAIRNLNF